MSLKPKFIAGKQPNDHELKRKSANEDRLGSYLQNLLSDWQQAKQPQEQEWLIDMRMFNKVNEHYINDDKVIGSHKHIYPGLAFKNCMVGLAKIVDPIFGKDKHWEISRTPKPDSYLRDQFETEQLFLEEIERRADAMELEIADNLITMDYGNNIKKAALEGVLLGTGCDKGVSLGVKNKANWTQTAEGFKYLKRPVVMPLMSSPSVWNLYVSPNAVAVNEVDKIFERHIMTRQQLSALKQDPRFDSEKIDRLLETSRAGNYTELYHETERKNITGETLTSFNSGEFDVYEFTGSLSGYELSDSNFNDDSIDNLENYWINLFFCNGITIANIKPISAQAVENGDLSGFDVYEDQKIPYHFFRYHTMPYQFWGRGIAWTNRASQYGYNGAVRSSLDNAAWSAHPQREINTSMLKEGQDPRIVYPGQTWLREKGDPSQQAVKFFQPLDNSNSLMNLAQSFDRMADTETMISKLTSGDSSNEINKTKGGMEMMLNVSSISTELAVKNLEDGIIKPFIKSMFEFLMVWHGDESIKGDFEIVPLISSVLLAKSARTQQLLQFSNTAAANPMTAKITDFKYLIEEIAKSLDVDPAKAIPELMPEQPPEQPVPDSALDQAKAALIQEQINTEKAKQRNLDSATANKNVASYFAAEEVAEKLVTAQAAAPGIIHTIDSIAQSAGVKDANAAPSAEMMQQQPTPEQLQQMAADNPAENTHPMFPSNPNAEGVEPVQPPVVQDEANAGSAVSGMTTSNQ
jgi:hypothetical protein